MLLDVNSRINSLNLVSRRSRGAADRGGYLGVGEVYSRKEWTRSDFCT